ncbi:RNA polymerase subunit sigma-70 [Arsenophonus nasoniae]|uniref:RNA polymerase subunit sigma-70 n=1 Tax=Arsenophonus nasoniae TaxID=638 RepID=UPI00387A2E1B
MNQAEFAKRHGVSRKTVTMWKTRGWLVMDGEEINVAASNANIERYRKTVVEFNKKTPKKTRVENKKSCHENESPTEAAERLIREIGAPMSLDEARRVKENFLALLAHLEYDTKSGKLLPYKDMINAVRVEYSRMRTRLIAIAPEHGPRLRALASTVNDHEFVAALQEVIYEAMEELSLGNSTNRRHEA